MIAMPSALSQLEQTMPRRRPAFVPRIPSMAEQIRAAADEATLWSQTVAASRKGPADRLSGANAERLRGLYLQALMKSPTVTLSQMLERYPHVSKSSFSWVQRSLIDRGWAERVDAGTRPLRIRITDAGRKAAADLPQSTEAK